MILCLTVLLILLLAPPSHTGTIGAFPDVNLNDPASLQEATRVLQEEVKLATRPHTYLLIDLVTQTIHIKGRGIDLHRIPIVDWSLTVPEAINGTHRVNTRPPITRRKIDPTASVEQEPISLADMPTDYTLSCTPPLTLTILSSPEDHPLQWIVTGWKTLWFELQEWTAAFSTDPDPAPKPSLRLKISTEQAQSLAWTMVDNMPLVVRRSADKNK